MSTEYFECRAAEIYFLHENATQKETNLFSRIEYTIFQLCLVFAIFLLYYYFYNKIPPC